MVCAGKNRMETENIYYAFMTDTPTDTDTKKSHFIIIIP